MTLATLDNETLEYLMHERGLDHYSELARLAGISRMTLYKARNGDVRLSTVLAVEKALRQLPVIPGSRLVRP